jgi:acetyltransferase-like isoleucine patch superfamily enzyme
MTRKKFHSNRKSNREGTKIEGENWIGANVLILGGVTIGKGVVIGAGSVVNKDLPPFTICVGNPCKPISKRIPTSKIINPFGNFTTTLNA